MIITKVHLQQKRQQIRRRDCSSLQFDQTRLLTSLEGRVVVVHNLGHGMKQVPEFVSVLDNGSDGNFGHHFEFVEIVQAGFSVIITNDLVFRDCGIVCWDILCTD